MYYWFFYNYEFFLLFLIFYIIFLHLYNRFYEIGLQPYDYICVSLLFLGLLIQCLINNLEGDSTVYLLNDYFIYNDYIKLIKMCMTLFLFIYLIILYNFNSIIKIQIVEYLLLIFTCFFSLIIIIISNNLFIIFVFLEIVNISLYCLIGLNKYSNKGIEAAFKYFIQSSFITIIGFFAISLIYINAGTLFIHELISIVDSSSNSIFIIKYSIYILIAVVFFKLGLFPLHSWIPDVYQGSFLIVALFIATIPKFAYMFLFFKLFNIMPNLLINYSFYVCLFSMIYGSIISLYQTSFKRLLAYGSMVHMGFIFYTLTINTTYGITASLFYLIVYILLINFIFCFLFFLYENNKDGLFFLDDISRLNYLLNNNKLFLFFFSYIILSLAGLPFFIGFISKWYIFISLLIDNKLIELFILLIVSVLSAAYYIRLIRFSNFIKNKDYKVKYFTVVKFKNAFYVLIVFLFILNLLVIFFYSWIYMYILKCVMTLFVIK